MIFLLPTALRMFMKRSKQVKGLLFETTLPEQVLTRADGVNAFYEARQQMAGEPELFLEEINAEIRAARKDRKM